MSRWLSSLLSLIVVFVALAAGMAYLLGAETPTGSVRGTLLAAETGAVLADTEVSLTVDLTGPGGRPGHPSFRPEREVRYRSRTDRRGRFTFPRVTTGTYHLSAQTNAHEAPKTPVRVAEGKVTEAVYELKPVDPFLRVFERQRVFTTREEPKLRVHGFVPAREMTVRTWRVRPDLLLKAWQGSLHEALGFRGDPVKADLDRIPGLIPVASVAHPVAKRDAEGVFREAVPLGRLAPGMYVIAFDALKVRALTAVTITDLGIIVKAAPGQVLVYAADIETGEPKPGTSITVRRNNADAATGVSNAQGLYNAALSRADREQEISVVGRSGSSVAIARTWLWSRDSDGPLRVYSYTDRPVYRPGHRVHFRSLLRELRDDRYTVPGGEQATIRVSDPNDETVYTAESRATGFGSLSGEFDLNPEALPGQYTMRVQPARGGVYEAHFMVAEYRKPEYEVTVEPAKERFTRGETVSATITARYYYGAPVPNARVNWSVNRSPHWYFEDGSEWDEDLSESAMYEEDYGSGEWIGSGEGRTDESGNLVVKVPLEPEDRDSGREGVDRWDPQDWRYTIEASVSDASERSEDGKGSVLVTQGDFRLNVSTGEYLARPGQAVSVEVRAVDYEGKPVPDVAGEVEMSRREWERGEEKVLEPSRQPFRTDAQGLATVSVSPARDGDWRIQASADDARGNTVQGSSYLWVMTGDYGDFDYPYQDLQVRADRTKYKEGETAEIVVNTKYAPRTALLTLESDGIVSSRLVRLTGKSTVLKVPVTSAMMPSVRASVGFIRKKNFLSGDAVLNVSREKKALQVQVTSDKASYQPGEPAVYRVKTLTSDGKPVAAEVSLGIVDAAVYAIAPDNTPNIVAWFYPRRVDEVRTAFSFPSVYLSGDDKAGSGIKTRRFFPDTAFWTAAAVTNDSGEATFRLTMPDNLTTWRATCRAADRQTRVGQATYEAVVSKPFLTRLQLPRFFTQGDEVEVAGVVHNLSGRGVDARVGMEPGSLTVLKSDRDRRGVDAGALERFMWRVRADTVGETKVRTWAEAGALNDAMELTVPILPKGRAHSDAISGDIAPTGAQPVRNHALQVRQDVIPGTQRLAVRLSPSLVGTMFGALDYLAAYPYGCAEQTMSAFLPDIVLVEMLKSRQVRSPALERKLPDMVRAGLAKLYGFQNEDGGFGWWEYDNSDPWMTVYVTYGLVRARDAGFPVAGGRLQRAQEAVARIAAGRSAGESGQPNERGKRPDADTRAFASYVLTVAGNREAAATATSRFSGPQNAAARGSLSDWGRAYIALALARTGRAEDARSLLNNTWTRVVNRKFIPDTDPDDWRSDAEYGAALLYAACEITPNHPKMGELVRWMVQERRGNHWSSTRDTAAVLYAFARYVALTGELQPALTATVTVNGRALASRRFTTADVMSPEAVITVLARDLPAGPVEVRVQAAGTGRLYYTAMLEQVAAEELSVPVRNASGIVVERAYSRVERGRGRTESNGGNDRSETRFRTGDVVEVTLTVRSQAPFEYIMVEDPLPAGLEAQDRGPVSEWDWHNWWSDQIFRDEKAAFAIRELSPGVRRLTYHAIAQTPGTFTALPPRVFDMYNPATQGEGAATTVTIR